MPTTCDAGGVPRAFFEGHATAAAWGVSIRNLLWTLLFFWFLYRTKGEVRAQYPMMPSWNQVVGFLTDWEGLRRLAA